METVYGIPYDSSLERHEPFEKSFLGQLADMMNKMWRQEELEAEEFAETLSVDTQRASVKQRKLHENDIHQRREKKWTSIGISNVEFSPRILAKRERKHRSILRKRNEKNHRAEVKDNRRLLPEVC